VAAENWKTAFKKQSVSFRRDTEIFWLDDQKLVISNGASLLPRYLFNRKNQDRWNHAFQLYNFD